MRHLCCTLLALCLLAPAARADREKIGRRPPHYDGKPPAAAVTAVRGPVLIGRSFLEAGSARELVQRLESARPAFEAALDSLAGPVVPGLDPAAFYAGAPSVYVGSPEGFYAPQRLDGSDDSSLPRDAILIRNTDPGGAWKKRVRAAADSAGATHVLVVTLELSDYPVSQMNWKGSKAVDLAAGHTMAVPWLTSLDQPVEVLQWTGSLYRADGRFVRGGAEAFHALRTPFGESALGLQRAITADGLEAALSARREDLADAPVAWRVALARLVAELAGRPRADGSPAAAP